MLFSRDESVSMTNGGEAHLVPKWDAGPFPGPYFKKKPFSRIQDMSRAPDEVSKMKKSLENNVPSSPSPNDPLGLPGFRYRLGC